MIAGRYSLEREVGRGGMGAVWLGRDEVLGRPVAIKRLATGPDTESSGLARAEQEARLAAQLNHPHVVTVYNLARDAESDARWLVMEYVEGTTLAQLVARHGPLTPHEAAPLLGQTADALAAAHAAGIVHRDVKPSNILLDTRRRAKLTDFGIARVAADPWTTRTGEVTGSPAYLAPELASGGRGREAVDVWSLGATAFHVLAGRPPYDTAENLMGGLFRLVNDEPPRLAGAGWMTPLFEHTMVKDPDARWSMAEVRDFLDHPPDRAVAPTPAAVVPTPLPSRSDVAPTPAGGRPGTGRRKRLLGALATLLLLALAVGAGLLLLPGPGDGDDSAVPGVDAPARPPSARPSPSPSSSPTSDGSSSPDGATPSPSSPSAGQAPPRRSAGPSPAPPSRPTAAGIEGFVRGYVAAVSSDPRDSFSMLTPGFQRESGGLATYRDFWSGVGEGQILAIDAAPRQLAVSYRVRFDDFGTGERPTVLDLVFDDGRYLIAGERTAGIAR